MDAGLADACMPAPTAAAVVSPRNERLFSSESRTAQSLRGAADQMKPRLLGANAARFGSTAASAVEFAPNHVASVAAY